MVLTLTMGALALGFHLWQDGFHHIQCAKKGDLHIGLPIGEVGLFKAGKAAMAVGAVDQAINAAKAFYSLGREVVALICLGNVGRNGKSFATIVFDLGPNNRQARSGCGHS